VSLPNGKPRGWARLSGRMGISEELGSSKTGNMRRDRQMKSRYTNGAALSALALSTVLAGCATTGSTDAADPFESTNRAVFAFNEVVDKNVIAPVAEGYTIVVPDPIRDNIRTFIRNLSLPFDIANNLLQGDFNGASTNTGRLMTNAILGFGFADVATAAGIGDAPADLGQTLAVWGMDSGPYIVVPILGPSNPRDLAGKVGGSFADPVGLYMPTTMSVSTGVVGGVDLRSRYLREIDELRKGSLDYYATMRSLSVQQRDAHIKGRKGAKADFPDYDAQPVAKK